MKKTAEFLREANSIDNISHFYNLTISHVKESLEHEKDYYLKMASNLDHAINKISKPDRTETIIMHDNSIVYVADYFEKYDEAKKIYEEIKSKYDAKLIQQMHSGMIHFVLAKKSLYAEILKLNHSL